MDELSMFEEGNNMNGKMGTKVFKSKNLEAERRRRQKLGDRLLALRSLVPFITNMNKATIIEDAITYIQKLQNDVRMLSDQLLEMESSSENCLIRNEIDAAEEMKKGGIQPEVEVYYIGVKKFMIKIIFAKKMGNFSKLMEAISAMDFKLTDISVTSFNGAILISSSADGICDETISVKQTRDILLQIVRDL